MTHFNETVTASLIRVRCTRLRICRSLITVYIGGVMLWLAMTALLHLGDSRKKKLRHEVRILFAVTMSRPPAKFSPHAEMTKVVFGIASGDCGCGFVVR